jgi:hypothetical protein
MEKEWCDEYQACDHIGFGLPDSVAAPTPAIVTITSEEGPGGRTEPIDFGEIDAKCAKDFLLSFGMEECEYLCQPVKCCFPFAQCSYPGQQSDCPRVQACNNFYNPPSEDLILEKICGEEELAEDEGACQDACVPYKCCFTDTICPADIRYDCAEYEPCQYYFETYAPDWEEEYYDRDSIGSGKISGQENAEHSFKSLCTSSALKENWETCKRHCSQFECCFMRENSCYKENTLECDEYAICEEFFFDAEEDEYEKIVESQAGSGDAVDDSSGVSASGNKQQSFKSLCTPSTLDQNHDACKRHCSMFECCFSEENSCFDEQTLECREYSVCEEFFKKTDRAQEKSSKTQCTESTIRQNWEECREHCSQYECCFSAENSCYNDKLQECDDNYICEEYFLDDKVGTSDQGGQESHAASSHDVGSVEAMNYRCSPAHLEKNLDACKDWCAPLECCYYFTNSCYSTRQEECDDHDRCEAVFDRLKHGNRIRD